MSFITNSSYSQSPSYDEPCKPDCENSEWVPAYPNPALVVTVVVDGYSINIAYRHRFACGMYHDYYIEQVGTDNDQNDMDYFLNTYGIKDALALLIEAFIIQNPAGFPPLLPGDPCEDNWRIMKGSCWKKSYAYGVPGGIPGSTEPVETKTEDQSLSGEIPEPMWHYVFRPCSNAYCCL